jgi:hypothetical protein
VHQFLEFPRGITLHLPIVMVGLMRLFELVRASCITEYHRPCDLNNRHLFTHSSGAEKTEINVPAGWFLVRFHFLSCKEMISHCVLIWLFLCGHLYVHAHTHTHTHTHTSGVTEFSEDFSFYKDTCPVGLGSDHYGLL